MRFRKVENTLSHVRIKIRVSFHFSHCDFQLHIFVASNDNNTKFMHEHLSMMKLAEQKNRYHFAWKCVCVCSFGDIRAHCMQLQ